jgi:transposase
MERSGWSEGDKKLVRFSIHVHQQKNKQQLRIRIVRMEAAIRGPELSLGKRMQIIGMHEGGISYAAIGRKLEVPEDTVRKICNRQKINPSGESAPRSGRPPKLNDRDRRHIVRYVRRDRTNRREPLADISKDLNLNVHPHTIKHVLEDAGLNHRIERKRPYLTKEQKKKRLEFAHKYIH